MNHRAIARFHLAAMTVGVGILLTLTLALTRVSGKTPPSTKTASILETSLSATTSTPPAYQAGSWVYTGGPIGGLGYDVRMDPRNPDVMYVTDAWAGAFKSVDGGANWLPINNGITTRIGPSLDGIPVFSLTIDPNNPNTLWAGTQYSSGVFRSDDNGSTWISMKNGITETRLSIRGFTVEPGNSDVVYLAAEVSSDEWYFEADPLPNLGMDRTKGVVYKTVDRGQNWTRIWLGDNLARYIWIHPTIHDLLFVSTGIFDREAANSVPITPTYQTGGVGLLRSSNGGQTWEVLDQANGLNADELFFGSLYMHPTNPDVLLAAAGNDTYTPYMGLGELGGIYRTANGGDSWDEVLDGLNFSVVEICEANPSVAYAGALGGFYRSEDMGLNWEKLVGRNWGPADVMAGFPIDAQCDPRDPMRVFVNNYGGGNILSEDGGETWTVSSAGYTGALMRQVAVARGNPARVYASARSGLFASQDGGRTWHGLAYGVARAMEGFALAVDPDDPAHVLATVQDAGPDPLVSWDRGESWAVVNTGLWPPGQPSPGDVVVQLVFAPADSQLVFATVGGFECLLAGKCKDPPGRGIIVSHDGGNNWVQTNLSSGNVLGLAVSSKDNPNAYAAVYGGGLYRSDDAGMNWELVNATPVPSSMVSTTVLAALAIDPGNPDRLYAGYHENAVAVSDDAGVSWTASAAGMPAEADVIVIVVDPTDPDVVYAGTFDRGVYVSLNGGSTWTALNDGLLTRAVRDLALSADGSVLYMASEGGGVFRLGTPLMKVYLPLVMKEN